SRFDRFGLRYYFEPLSLLSCQEYRVRTVSRRSPRHCSNFRVLRGIIADYPNLSTDDLRIILVHSRGRILPELSESLADYAMQRMRERGVTFKLNTRVVDASPGSISLSPSEEIPTETFVWTAGATPNPLLKELPIKHDSRGAVLVDQTLAIPDSENR